MRHGRAQDMRDHRLTGQRYQAAMAFTEPFGQRIDDPLGLTRKHDQAQGGLFGRG